MRNLMFLLVAASSVLLGPAPSISSQKRRYTTPDHREPSGGALVVLQDLGDFGYGSFSLQETHPLANRLPTTVFPSFAITEFVSSATPFCSAAYLAVAPHTFTVGPHLGLAPHRLSNATSGVRCIFENRADL
ncbi:hypothetical protein BDW22DRAFT_1428107 [Trametopsis cervina]|nr:hypothetical protein BDW22DRAFT_1428107 [Trametopsis cervina]